MALKINLRRLQIQIHRRFRQHIHHPVIQMIYREHDGPNIFRRHYKVQQSKASFHKQRKQSHRIKGFLFYCNHSALSCKLYQTGHEKSVLFLAVFDCILAIQPLIYSFSFT